MMTQMEMERLLENIDRRLTSVEQKLPTLATKDDLARFSTKEDLERYATKEDLERVSQDAERLARMLNEETRDHLRMVADGVLHVQEQVSSLTRRLEIKGVI